MRINSDCEAGIQLNQINKGVSRLNMQGVMKEKRTHN